MKEKQDKIDMLVSRIQLLEKQYGQANTVKQIKIS